MDLTANKFQTKDIAYIGIFTALMAICSWISLPLPSGIPVTLQTFGVFLAVGILGGRRGTLAVAAYLLLGLVGAPVLAGFSGGVGSYLTPSGGYLVGFLFTALLMWGMERLLGQKKWVLLLSMVAYAKSEGAVGLLAVLGWCVFPYLLPDAVKLALAWLLSGELRRHVR